MFQNSSECKEALDTQYQLCIRNSDALGDIHVNIHQRLKQQTPGQVIRTCRHYSDITHSDVSVSQRVQMDNPDSNGQTVMSIKNTKKLGMIFGSDVYDLQYQRGQ